eukprot:1157864-Pelagomonas_calceolata.AAC.2
MTTKSACYFQVVLAMVESCFCTSCDRVAPSLLTVHKLCPPQAVPVLSCLQYGRDSAFARAVAQGSVEPGAPVLNALAHDLDKLQDISVDMRELATYIAEVAPTCGSTFVAAGVRLIF